MEALSEVKRPMVGWGAKESGSAERERAFDRIRNKKKWARVLTFCFFFTKGFSVDNKLMKRFFFLFYRRIFHRNKLMKQFILLITYY